MKQTETPWADRWGTVASSVCALHCAVCALLPAALAGLGLGALLSPKAEWGFTLVAVALGGMALVLGWRVHRSRRVAALLSLGILALLASRVLEMGGEHGHHGEGHAEETSHGTEVHPTAEGHHSEEGHDDHDEAHAAGNGHGEHEEGHGEEEAHNDALHLAGAGVGVIGGLLLVFGHLLNIRTTRRTREEDCCD